MGTAGGGEYAKPQEGISVERRRRRDMKDEIVRSCVDCGSTRCDEESGTYPHFCLSQHMAEGEKEALIAAYGDEENYKIMLNAAQIEYEGYCKLCRVEETMEFARRMGYKKIGIATCLGLIREARILTKVLRANGFEVFGVGCKAGEIRKTAVGIPAECENLGEHICNPIYQAKMLAEANCELNIVVGLCVGHDSLFYKYAQGVTTTLVVKDRVTGNNPAAALYNAEGYYRRKLFPQKGQE